MRRLYDDARRVFVGRGGKLHVNVAIAGNQPDQLRKSVRNVKQLQLPAGTRRVGSRSRPYRKIDDVSDCDLLRGHRRQINVLGGRAVIDTGRLGWIAITQVGLFFLGSAAAPFEREQRHHQCEKQKKLELDPGAHVAGRRARSGLDLFLNVHLLRAPRRYGEHLRRANEKEGAHGWERPLRKLVSFVESSDYFCGVEVPPPLETGVSCTGWASL